MNSYFLCVTQPSNAGDLLINRMLIEELSLYGKVYVDCYNCPKDFRVPLLGNTENVVDVNNEYDFTLKRGAFFSFSKLLEQNEIGLYTQSPGPLNKHSKWSLRISFSIIRTILSALHIPFVRIGCCCSTAISTHTNVIESRKVQYYVRSRIGVEFLKNYRNYGINYIPDLAFLYHYKVKFTSKRKMAVISFREVTDCYEQFLKWLKDSISILIASEYKIIFYYQVKSDEAFMRKLFYQFNSDTITYRKHILWYDEFDFYADKTIVISNRLHCLLMGAVYNAIPFAYDDNGLSVRKISDVFVSVMGGNASNFLAQIDDHNKLLNLLGNTSKYQRVISNNVDENAQLCRSTIKYIVDYCKAARNN